ncbi:Serum response factor-binding protein 1 [Frankliniella fusca]|uniref:Serum response factor-binding protein 1 n=1 Tax=Frankliniella fusca TaxID=407009 RepID=A0AAE1L9T8_9NEOP|nr:Serum response factor-binding protein 1 [Frankliniella fusca]
MCVLFLDKITKRAVFIKTMLNKTDVSNQITGLRPKVKQAAVHLAHHLTREIKKFQARKGPKAEKFHKRAETYRQEVIILKKIKADSVSRYALEMDFSDREKLLGDITLPLETKVIVKLATHKSVASHVESFREKHPEWKSKLSHLLETLGIRAKFKKKVQKNQEKQKRKLARKQKEDGEETKQSSTPTVKVKSSVEKKSNNKSVTSIDINKGASDEDNQSSGDENAPGTHHNKFQTRGSQSEDDDSDDGVEDKFDEDDNKSDDCEESEENGEDDDDSDDFKSEDAVLSDSDDDATEGAEGKMNVDASIKKEKSTKILKSNVNDQISRTSENKLAEVRRFADLLENQTLVNSKATESKSLIPKDKESSKRLSDCEPVEEDTFFMTEENRFLKTTAVNRGNGEGLESSSRISRNVDEETNQWSVDGKKLKGNRAERRAKFLGRDIKKRKPRQMDKSNEFVRRQKDQKNGSTFNKFQINTETHVEGKSFKPKFDKQSLSGRKDDDFSKKNGKITDSKQPSSASETLHPSWEAKRKQKVSLDNFQGKKIKFDDD